MPNCGERKQGSKIVCEKPEIEQQNTLNTRQNFVLFNIISSAIKPSYFYKNNTSSALIKVARSIFILMLLSGSILAQGQAGKDSVAIQKIDSLKKATADEVDKIKNKTDSAISKVTTLQDSLSKVATKITAFPQTLDTLKFVKRMDSLRLKMEALSSTDRLFLFDPDLSKIDSLKAVMQSQANQATARIDKTATQIQTTVDSIQRAYTEKVQQVFQKWGLENPGMADYHGQLIEKMDFNVPAVSTQHPEFTKGFNFKNLWPDLKMGDFKLDDLQKLNLNAPTLNVGMPSMDALKDFKTSFSKVKGIKSELKSYQAELDSIRAGGLENSDKLKGLAEQQLTQREEIQTIKQHEQELEKIKQLQQEYLTKAEQYRDPERLKAEALQKGSEVVTDQVLGQTEKLTEAQSKLAKAKRKYGEFESINDLPKHRPNAMKDKPFRERFFPGFTFQLAKKDQYTSLYLSPQMYYRISGKWDVGAGGIFNLNFDKKLNWVSGHNAWGYKVLTNFRFFKSFYFRVEGERVNQELPAFGLDNTYTRWTYVALGGIGKEFKISRLLNGNTLLLYNAKGQEFNPYASRVVLRVGIDFSLKKDQRRQFIKGLTK